MKWTKSFALILLILSFWVINDLSRESYSFSEKICWVEFNKITTDCSIEFLPFGTIKALSHHAVLGLLFEGGVREVQPSPTLGYVLLGALILLHLLLLIGAGFLVRFIYNDAKRSQPVAPKAAPTADFRLAVIGLLMCGIIGVMALEFLPSDMTNHQVVISPTIGKSHSDPKVLIQLSDQVSDRSVDKIKFESNLRAFHEKKLIDPQGFAKIFNTALGQCRDDLVEVLMKFEMQPDPRKYVAAYMLSLYTTLTDPNCEKIYRSMGWSKGCEVEEVPDFCAEFDSRRAEYFSLFENATNAPNALCNQDQDCLLSERVECGFAIAAPKSGFSASDLKKEATSRCPIKKLLILCARQNSGYQVCHQDQNFTPKCVNAKCVAMPW